MDEGKVVSVPKNNIVRMYGDVEIKLLAFHI
jgi:hypothetical protein